MYNANKINKRKQDALNGYKQASDLWCYHDEHLWSMFNTMILANSILIVSAGWLFATDNPTDPRLLSFLSYYVIPILGIILCFIWLMMTVRAATYRRYYVFAARALEKKAGIDVISRGSKLQEGEDIVLNLGGNETKTIKMPYIGRFYDTWSSYIIISLFGVVHLVMLLSKHYKTILQFFGIM